MKSDLTRICICSGNKETDISRADTGITYRESLENKVPIRILGAGPELDLAIKNYNLFKDNKISEKEYSEILDHLDQHIGLYNYVIEKTGEIPETITKPTTLVQNVLYGFQDFEKGTFAIVTEPWHYEKFNWIQQVLKKRGKISGNLEFFNVASPDTNYYSPIQKILSNIKSRAELMTI